MLGRLCLGGLEDTVEREPATEDERAAGVKKKAEAHAQVIQNESIMGYIIKAETTITALRNAGGTLVDDQLVAMVLKGVPKSYKPFSINTVNMDLANLRPGSEALRKQKR